MTKKMKSIDDEGSIRKYGFGCIDKALPHIRAEYFNSFTPNISTILKIFNELVPVSYSHLDVYKRQVRRGVDDPQHRQLIAGRLTGQSAPAQSQLLAVFGVGRDVERHRPAQGGHFDLAAQRRFPRRQRQLQAQIAALQLVQRVMTDANL